MVKERGPAISEESWRTSRRRGRNERRERKEGKKRKREKIALNERKRNLLFRRGLKLRRDYTLSHTVPRPKPFGCSRVSTQAILASLSSGVLENRLRGRRNADGRPKSDVLLARLSSLVDLRFVVLDHVACHLMHISSSTDRPRVLSNCCK